MLEHIWEGQMKFAYNGYGALEVHSTRKPKIPYFLWIVYVNNKKKAVLRTIAHICKEKSSADDD